MPRGVDENSAQARQLERDAARQQREAERAREQAQRDRATAERDRATQARQQEKDVLRSNNLKSSDVTGFYTAPDGSVRPITKRKFLGFRRNAAGQPVAIYRNERNEEEEVDPLKSGDFKLDRDKNKYIEIDGERIQLDENLAATDYRDYMAKKDAAKTAQSLAYQERRIAGEDYRSALSAQKELEKQRATAIKNGTGAFEGLDDKIQEARDLTEQAEAELEFARDAYNNAVLSTLAIESDPVRWHDATSNPRYASDNPPAGAPPAVVEQQAGFGIGGSEYVSATPEQRANQIDLVADPMAWVDQLIGNRVSSGQQAINSQTEAIARGQQLSAEATLEAQTQAGNTGLDEWGEQRTAQQMADTHAMGEAIARRTSAAQMRVDIWERIAEEKGGDFVIGNQTVDETIAQMRERVPLAEAAVRAEYYDRLGPILGETHGVALEDRLRTVMDWSSNTAEAGAMRETLVEQAHTDALASIVERARRHTSAGEEGDLEAAFWMGEQLDFASSRTQQIDQLAAAIRRGETPFDQNGNARTQATDLIDRLGSLSASVATEFTQAQELVARTRPGQWILIEQPDDDRARFWMRRPTGMDESNAVEMKFSRDGTVHTAQFDYRPDGNDLWNYVSENHSDEFSDQSGFTDFANRFWRGLSSIPRDAVHGIFTAANRAADSTIQAGIDQIDSPAGRALFSSIQQQSNAEIQSAFDETFEELDQIINDHYDTDTARDILALTSKSQRIRNGVVDGLAQLPGMMAVGAATGGVGLFAMNGMAMGQSAYDDAIAHGATPEDAFKVFLLNGSIGGGLETASDLFLLGGGKVVSRLMPDSMKRPILTSLFQLGSQSASEGLTEGAQTIWENTLAKAFYDQSRDVWAGVDEAMAIGAIVGVFASTPGTVLNYRSLRRQNEAQVALEEAFKEAQRQQQLPADTRQTGADDIQQADASSGIREQANAAMLQNRGFDASMFDLQGLRPETVQAVVGGLDDATSYSAAVQVGTVLNYTGSQQSIDLAEQMRQQGASEAQIAVAQQYLAGSVTVANAVENALAGRPVAPETLALLTEAGILAEENGHTVVPTAAMPILPAVLRSKIENAALENLDEDTPGGSNVGTADRPGSSQAVKNTEAEGRRAITEAAEATAGEQRQSFDVTVQMPDGAQRAYEGVLATDPEQAVAFVEGILARQRVQGATIANVAPTAQQQPQQQPQQPQQQPQPQLPADPEFAVQTPEQVQITREATAQAAIAELLREIDNPERLAALLANPNLPTEVLQKALEILKLEADKLEALEERPETEPLAGAEDHRFMGRGRVRPSEQYSQTETTTPEQGRAWDRIIPNLNAGPAQFDFTLDDDRIPAEEIAKRAQAEGITEGAARRLIADELKRGTPDMFSGQVEGEAGQFELFAGAVNEQDTFDFGLSGDLGDKNQRGLDLDPLKPNLDLDLDGKRKPSKKKARKRARKGKRIAASVLAEYLRDTEGMGAGRAAATELSKMLEQGEAISILLHDKAPNHVPAFDVRGLVIKTPADFAAANAAMRNPYVESLRVAILDSSDQVVYSELLTIGDISESVAPPARIAAVLARANQGNQGERHRRLLLSHNHPSGDPKPSRADFLITKRMKKVLGQLDAELVDHVITNGETFYSLSEGSMGVMPGYPRPDWEPDMERGKSPLVEGPSDVQEIIHGLRAKNSEAVYAIHLSTRHRVLAIQQLGKDQSAWGRQIADAALLEGNRKVILSTPTDPSEGAAKAMLQMKEELETLTITVLDAVGPKASAHERGLFAAGPARTPLAVLRRAIAQIEDALAQRQGQQPQPQIQPQAQPQQQPAPTPTAPTAAQTSQVAPLVRSIIDRMAPVMGALNTQVRLGQSHPDNQSGFELHPGADGSNRLLIDPEKIERTIGAAVADGAIDSEQLPAYLDAIFSHELIHSAQNIAALESGQSFNDYFGAIEAEMTEAERAATIEHYGQHVSGPILAAEYVRMLVELRLDGRTTEAAQYGIGQKLLDHLKRTLGFLKKALKALNGQSTALAQAVDSVEALIREARGEPSTEAQQAQELAEGIDIASGRFEYEEGADAAPNPESRKKSPDPAKATTPTEGIQIEGPGLEVPYDTTSFDEATRTRSDSSGTAPVVNLSQRLIRFVRINGVLVPFYLSSGYGGKKTVAQGKWYPIFGLTRDGWLNKGTSEQINDYYGSELLREAAQQLDARFGSEIDPNAPRVLANGKLSESMAENLGVAPVENGTKDTKAELAANIESVLARIEGKPAAKAEPKTETKPAPEPEPEPQVQEELNSTDLEYLGIHPMYEKAAQRIYRDWKENGKVGVAKIAKDTNHSPEIIRKFASKVRKRFPEFKPEKKEVAKPLTQEEREQRHLSRMRNIAKKLAALASSDPVEWTSQVRAPETPLDALHHVFDILSNEGTEDTSMFDDLAEEIEYREIQQAQEIASREALGDYEGFAEQVVKQGGIKIPAKGDPMRGEYEATLEARGSLPIGFFTHKGQKFDEISLEGFPLGSENDFWDLVNELQEGREPLPQFEGEGALFAPGTIYASGLTKGPSDIDAAIAEGKAIGIAATYGTTNAGNGQAAASDTVQKKVVDYVNQGGEAFVDSGAFTDFKAGRGTDFEGVRQIYDRMLERVKPDRRHDLHLVVPDVVGDQAATLELQEVFREDVAELARAGASIIWPVQREAGAPNLADAVARSLGDISERNPDAIDQITIGIPYNAMAWRREEVLDFIAAYENGHPGLEAIFTEMRRVPRIHLLGGGTDKVNDIDQASGGTEIEISGDSLYKRVSGRKRPATQGPMMKTPPKGRQKKGPDSTTDPIPSDAFARITDFPVDLRPMMKRFRVLSKMDSRKITQAERDEQTAIATFHRLVNLGAPRFPDEVNEGLQKRPEDYSPEKVITYKQVSEFVAHIPDDSLREIWLRVSILGNPNWKWYRESRFEPESYAQALFVEIERRKTEKNPGGEFDLDEDTLDPEELSKARNAREIAERMATKLDGSNRAQKGQGTPDLFDGQITDDGNSAQTMLFAGGIAREIPSLRSVDDFDFSTDEGFDEWGKAIDDHHSEIQAWVDAYPKDKPIIVHSPDSPFVRTVTPDIGGGWRSTTWDRKGPVSHASTESRKEAFEMSLESGAASIEKMPDWVGSEDLVLFAGRIGQGFLDFGTTGELGTAAQIGFDFTTQKAPEPKKKPEPAPAPDDFKLEGSPAPSKPSKPKTAKPKTRPIEDFGEKIGGARKDVWGGFLNKWEGESIPEDGFHITMAKHWPEPNYAKAAKDGVPPESLYWFRALRDMVGPKPRRSWQLREWAKDFKAYHKIAELALDGHTDSLADTLLDPVERPELYGALALARALGPERIKQSTGWSITRGEFGMFAGQKFDKNQIIWTARHKRRDLMQLNSRDADPMTAATSVAQQIVAHIDANPTAKKKTGGRGPMKFKIYQDRRTRDVFIARKKGQRLVRVKGGFSKPTEARQYIADNQEQLEETFQQMTKPLDLRNPENRPREGVPLRNTDVTPEDFQRAFGFRGVEFGNWVEDKRRQADLNQAYDGLIDLANALDIPTLAISLNGTLGLAFGARGTGGKNAAAAHYEPGFVAINLTKKAGPGSLAHEWFHALDNHFGRVEKQGASGWITQMKESVGHVRRETMAAFNGVMDFIMGSGLYTRSKEEDVREGKKDPYYGTKIEMAARAFEGYVVERTALQGIQNDYLVNISKEGKPVYPTPEEMDNGLRAAWDTLFETLDTDHSPQGVRLFAGGVHASPAYQREAAKTAGAVLEGNAREMARVIRAVAHDPQWLEARGITTTKQALRYYGDLLANKKRIREKPQAPPVAYPAEGGKILAGPALFAPAWHGTPHEFDSFSTEFMSTGEGAQAFGWGLYFGQAKEVAESYRKDLSADGGVLLDGESMEDLAEEMVRNGTSRGTKAQQARYEALDVLDRYGVEDGREMANDPAAVDLINKWEAEGRIGYTGNLYKVELDIRDEEWLDYDEQLGNQSELVKKALGLTGDIEALHSEALQAKLAELEKQIDPETFDESDLQREIASLEKQLIDVVVRGSTRAPMDKASAMELRAKGVKGIRFLDEQSRQLGRGKYNVRWEGNDAINGTKAEVFEMDSGEIVGVFDTFKEADEWVEQNRPPATYNYVVFDEADIEITERNGEPVRLPDEQLALFASGPVANATLDRMHREAREIAAAQAVEFDKGTENLLESWRKRPREAVEKKLAKRLGKDWKARIGIQKVATGVRWIGEGGGDFDKSSTQINLPDVIADRFREFTDKIDPADLHEKGIEKEHHITALYGITEDTPVETVKALADLGPIRYEIGGLSLFENAEFDVLKADIDSRDLHRLNSSLREVPHENDFPDYKPHATLAYLKKGTGKKYLKRRFGAKGRAGTAAELVFSSGEGRYGIDLAGDKTPPLFAPKPMPRGTTQEQIDAAKRQINAGSEAYLENQENAKGLRKELRDAKRTASSFVVAATWGRVSQLDYWSGLRGGRGDAGQQLTEGETNASLSLASIKAHEAVIQSELKHAIPKQWRNRLTRRFKLARFMADLQQYAARLNPVKEDLTGYEFEGFDLRVGTMSQSMAAERNLRPGSLINEGGRVFMLGDFNEDVEGFLLLERMDAETQAELHRDFHEKYPELAFFLDRWIEPGRENDRFIGPQGVETPTFNRHSLRSYLGESPYGDPGTVAGYTPDVVRREIVAGIMWANIKRKLGMDKGAHTGAPRAIGGLLQGKKSGARKTKTGTARENGLTVDMFKGFSKRAYEAHSETTRVELAERLLKSSLVPAPETGITPNAYVRLDKNVLNRLFKSLALTADENTTGNSKFWDQILETGKVPGTNRNLPFNSGTTAYSPAEVAILRKMFGSNKELLKLLQQDNMIHRNVFQVLSGGFHSAQFDSRVLKLAKALADRYTVGLLVRPATAAFNWISPQLQAMHAASLYATNGALHIASTDPELRAIGRGDLRASIEVMKGLVTNRFTRWSGIDRFLPDGERQRGTLNPENEAKGIVELVREGKFGHAIKKATDQRRRIGDVIPPELFDGANAFSVVLEGHANDTVLQELKSLNVGAAALKLIRFQEMDGVVKQNLAYAALMGHAKVQAKLAKVPRRKRAKWVREWMKNPPREHLNAAMATSKLFGFDYANVPLWLDPRYGILMARPMKALILKVAFPFSGFIASYTKLLAATTAGAAVDVVKGGRDERGGDKRRKGLANLALWAVAVYLFMDDDDDEEIARNPNPTPEQLEKLYRAGILGTDYDDMGREIPYWDATGGKLNLDAIADRFGLDVADALRAYLEANGVTDAQGMEMWIDSRSLPYIQFAAMLAALGEVARDTAKGKDPQLLKALGLMRQTAEMYMAYGPSQSLLGMTNKYNDHLTYGTRNTQLGYDLLTSGALPSPWRKDITRLLDPVKRMNVSNDMHEHTPLQEILRTTPGLSELVPPAVRAGGIRTQSLPLSPAMGAQFAEDVETLREMGIDPALAFEYGTDSFGDPSVTWLDPEAMKTQTRAEFLLRNLARIEGRDKQERLMAERGIGKSEIYKILKKQKAASRATRAGEVVPTNSRLTEEEEIKLRAFQRLEEGKEWQYMLLATRERDAEILSQTINPATQQRVNQLWTEEEEQTLFRAVWRTQPTNALGEFVDPNTGQTLEEWNEANPGRQQATWQLGHIAGREWRVVENLPEYQNATARQVAQAELNPDYYVWEIAAENMSGRHEGTRRKTPVRSQTLPATAYKP